VKPLAVKLDGAPLVGSYIRAVGFGKRGQKAGAGKKYARDHVRVLDRSENEFVVGESTCSGDSGGPALDASGAVVGVVSRGGPACTGSNATNIYTATSAFSRLIKRALPH
jgi:secreted trypsin-like serine protease